MTNSTTVSTVVSNEVDHQYSSLAKSQTIMIASSHEKEEGSMAEEGSMEEES